MSSPTVYTVSLSAVDEERFGIRTARATCVTAKDVGRLIEFCKREKVSFLIARCSSSELDAAQAMESEGFFLTDTQIHYVRDLNRGITFLENPAEGIRPLKPDETQKVVEIAAECFSGYMGHYHADPRLDRKKCDEAYVSWAKRSCLSKEVAHHVLVAEREEGIVGFATLRMNDSSVGEGVLFGVSPRARRAGVYGRLMIAGLHWCKEKGASTMIVSTQVTNFAVQKVWIRLGFEPFKAVYTFHRWFP